MYFIFLYIQYIYIFLDPHFSWGKQILGAFYPLPWREFASFIGTTPPRMAVTRIFPCWVGNPNLNLHLWLLLGGGRPPSFIIFVANHHEFVKDKIKLEEFERRLEPLAEGWFSGVGPPGSLDLRSSHVYGFGVFFGTCSCRVFFHLACWWCWGMILIEHSLHHLLCMKSVQYDDILEIKWCRVTILKRMIRKDKEWYIHLGNLT